MDPRFDYDRQYPHRKAGYGKIGYFAPMSLLADNAGYVIYKATGRDPEVVRSERRRKRKEARASRKRNR